MNKIFGLDTETVNGFPQTLQIYSEDVYFFREVSKATILPIFMDFLNELSSNESNYIFYCINLSFDMAEIFYNHLELLEIEEFDFDWDDWNIKGVYTAANCFCSFYHKSRKKKAMLVNASAFFSGTAENLAKKHCPTLPKLEKPRDLGKIYYNKYTKAEQKDFLSYAMRDAQIGYYTGLSIERLHVEYKTSQCVSVPQMAGKIFRTHFLKQDIVSPAKGLVYNAYHSYRGGKNGLYCQPGYYKNVVGLDIISAYTWAMAKLPSFTKAENYLTMWGTRDIYPEYGIYQITGTAKKCIYPILMQKDDRDCYKAVDGEFENIWIPGPELNEGVLSGEIIVKKCYGYYYKPDGIESDWKTFALHFFNLKNTAQNDIDRTFFKLMTNALYGKTVEARKKPAYYDIKSKIMHTEDEFKPGPLFFPWAGTLISSYTRAKMHQLEHKYKSLHTSTDGLIVKKQQFDLNNDLGGIKIEFEGDALFFRNKFYLGYADNPKKGDLKPIKSTIFPDKYIVKYALHGFQGKIADIECMYKEKTNTYIHTHVNKIKESARSVKKEKIVNNFEEVEATVNINWTEFI